jgi:hypothetical protein
MKVSLDDGKTWIDANTVRLIQEIDDPTDYEDDEPIQAELHFCFTEEGLVTDVWIDDACDGTSSEMYVEMGDRLVNGG